MHVFAGYIHNEKYHTGIMGTHTSHTQKKKRNQDGDTVQLRFSLSTASGVAVLVPLEQVSKVLLISTMLFESC